MELDVIRALSKTLLAIKSVYKSDKVYYNDLIMLALVFDKSKHGKVTAFEVTKSFPEFSYKLRARLLKLTYDGYLVDKNSGGRVSDYRITMKGELLLRRYADLLEGLVKGCG